MPTSPDASAPLRSQHERWHRRARHAGVALFLVAVLGFLAPVVAPAFDDIRILGMRLGFFAAAEGVPLVLLLLAVWSIRAQGRIQAPDEPSPGEPG
jgi:putative solute:sodium symporter small subunit